MKYETIVILCAHHSGSSAIAGALHHMGIEMTDKPGRKDKIHPYGIWERGAFQQLNDKILSAAGGSWDKPPPHEKILNIDRSEQIKKLIGSVKAKPWGWKDPRTALTAELWHPHLTNPFYVVIWRDIESMVCSYEHYKSKFGELGDLSELAEIYIDRINKFIKGKPCYHIMWYENLLEFPRFELKILTEKLDLEATEAAVKMVDSSCRHF